MRDFAPGWTGNWRNMDDKLAEYRRKRELRGTPEPAGATGSRRRKPRFVIQQHDASSMHYDFRLEVDGVLKSWAVPKGPSTDPREKRLAVAVEDHPLDYGGFEGVIPEGHYGAGRVIVWDAGTYRNLGADPLAQAFDAGHASIWLDGQKLRGGYALTRIARTGKSERWLLVKIDDEAADRRRHPVSTQPESVLSGHTVKDVR